MYIYILYILAFSNFFPYMLKHLKPGNHVYISIKIYINIANNNCMFLVIAKTKV